MRFPAAKNPFEFFCHLHEHVRLAQTNERQVNSLSLKHDFACDDRPSVRVSPLCKNFDAIKVIDPCSDNDIGLGDKEGNDCGDVSLKDQTSSLLTDSWFAQLSTCVDDRRDGG